MTVEEFAAKLDGRQYGNEITEDEAILAENLDFLVVFGASDDLAELRGAIDGECDCFEGGVLKRGEGRSLPIKAVWCPEGRDCSWAYETELPHAEFKIMEEGDVYCYGVVCALNGTPKMYRCPFCGKEKLHIGVHDDEGNYHGELGCAYESDPWSGLSYGIHHDGWGECLLCTDDTNGVAGGMLFDTSCEAYDAMAELVRFAEVDHSTDLLEGTFLGEESNTTTMKFKPVCERCGYTLPSLSLRGNTSSGYMREWHFQPFSCPRCGRRIVTAEIPRIKAGEIDYTE